MRPTPRRWHDRAYDVKLTVVGCSGSIAGPDSPASCYLVEADGFRMVLDLGTRPETDAAGDPIPDTEMPDQLCTQLVEEDGSQLLTFSIATPSRYAATPYRFFVPGVDGAEVLVDVP